MTRTPDPTGDYAHFIDDLKQRVAAARLSAARAVNRDLIALYWDIGKAILEKQQALGWGQAVVEQIARDLRASFPGTQGFSARNVWDMRRLYEAYAGTPFLRQLVAESPGMPPRRAQRSAVAAGVEPGLGLLRQLVAEVPWGHHLVVLGKVSEPAERIFYLKAVAAFGWSRNVLLNQIKARAYERSLSEGKSHNFPVALPGHLAEQAEEALKSSYNLEFLGIRQAVKERDLENQLID